MLEAIETVSEPEAAATVWRFTGFTKYVAMLHRRALFFARADQLLDPFEGEYARHDHSPRARDPMREALHERVFVSCWHRNDHESEAMWRIYSSGGGGIAIRSAFVQLSEVRARPEHHDVQSRRHARSALG